MTLQHAVSMHLGSVATVSIVSHNKLEFQKFNSHVSTKSWLINLRLWGLYKVHVTLHENIDEMKRYDEYCRNDGLLCRALSVESSR